MIIGASGGGVFPQLFITSSRTWVPPQDGNICIHVVGAGGGGMGRGASGGGAGGGYVRKNSHAVTTSDSFTIVIGNGGYPSANTSAATAGGNSTFAGTGLSGTMLAAGGGGGVWSGGGTRSTATDAGPGDFSRLGGNGNNGGGAVGIHGNGEGGGSYSASSGQTDAVAGGLATSAFGEICGGTAVPNTWGSTNVTGLGDMAGRNGGDLCGGGGAQTSGAYARIRGGNGGIGGGGGLANNISNPTVGQSGFGGDGVVLIQYLPW